MAYIGKTPTAAPLTSSDITDGIITTAKIAADAVTDAKIADDVVGTEHLTAGEVDTTAIASDAITLAKMASGTDGNIITYDASGNPVVVATGSDGQVLTSAGAGAPPVFETASGGDFVKLSTVVASTAANVEFDDLFSTTYDYYKIFCRYYPSAASELHCRFNRSGSAVTTSNYDYHGCGGEGYSGSANNSQSLYAEDQAQGIILGSVGGDVDDTHADGFWGCILNIDIYDPLGTVFNPTIYNNETHYSSNGGRFINTSSVVTLSDDTFSGISGILLYPNTGTVTGMFSLYGIKP